MIIRNARLGEPGYLHSTRMDPITHTVLGATAAHAILGRRLGRPALLFGAAGGAIPDIDVAWGFLSDPALPWEYHRDFTHALPFVPVMGLLAAAPLLLLFKRFRPQARLACLAAIIGAATHGLNDASTSFGTFLYWPFYADRVSFDIISIIDPLFTIPLILGVLIALIIKSAWPAQIALAMAVAYLALGFVQNQRVLGVQEQLAADRGHERLRGRAMPTLGNVIVWRSLYEDVDGRLHADAVRAGIFAEPLVRRGESVQRYTADRLPEAQEGDYVMERVRSVFTRFSAFADGYTAYVRDMPGAMGDMRYSLQPHTFDPLWGLQFRLDDPFTPVAWVGFAQRDRDARGEAVRAIWRDLWRPDDSWQPLEAEPDDRRVEGPD
jgi:inner membrane protein